LRPHGENVGSLAIDLGMATSTGAPMLLKATGSFERDDAALRWPAEVNYVRCDARCVETRMADRAACLHSMCFRDGRTHLRPR